MNFIHLYEYDRFIVYSDKRSYIQKNTSFILTTKQEYNLIGNIHGTFKTIGLQKFDLFLLNISNENSYIMDEVNFFIKHNNCNYDKIIQKNHKKLLIKFFYCDQFIIKFHKSIPLNYFLEIKLIANLDSPLMILHTYDPSLITLIKFKIFDDFNQYTILFNDIINKCNMNGIIALNEIIKLNMIKYIKN